MLLPQSSAFAALKNRLNSVSNIGFLQGGPRTAPPQPSTSFDRSTGTRLKSREENTIRWGDLLDKFKAVQERARRAQASQRQSLDQNDSLHPSISAAFSAAAGRDRSGLPDAPRGTGGLMSPGSGGMGLGAPGPSVMAGLNRGMESNPKAGPSTSIPTQKPKSSLSSIKGLAMGRKPKRWDRT